MSRNPDQQPQQSSPEANEALTGDAFFAILDNYTQLSGLSPYAKKDSPAADAYDRVRLQVERGRELNDRQVSAIRYMTLEINLMQAQVMVDKQIIANPDTFQDAVGETNDVLNDAIEASTSTLTAEERAGFDEQIELLDAVWDRIESGQEPPDGTELLAYLKSDELIEYWGSEFGRVPQWAVDDREQKRVALDAACVQLKAEGAACIMLSEKYPSDLALEDR